MIGNREVEEFNKALSHYMDGSCRYLKILDRLGNRYRTPGVSISEANSLFIREYEKITGTLFKDIIKK